MVRFPRCDLCLELRIKLDRLWRIKQKPPLLRDRTYQSPVTCNQPSRLHRVAAFCFTRYRSLKSPGARASNRVTCFHRKPEATFRRYLAPPFTHYLSERPEMSFSRREFTEGQNNEKEK